LTSIAGRRHGQVDILGEESRASSALTPRVLGIGIWTDE
jgi:hypothetical protein